MSEKHKLGMVIGRFQHLHIGHVEMIKQGLQACDKVIVMVGSSQESMTVRNPFHATIRMEIIKQAFHEEIQEKRLFVSHIEDLTNEDDHSTEWGDYVMNRVEMLKREFSITDPLECMIYGNDEERKGWYNPESVDGITQLVLDRGNIDISATKMREFLTNNDVLSWCKHMPIERIADEKLGSLYTELRSVLSSIPFYRQQMNDKYLVTSLEEQLV